MPRAEVKRVIEVPEESSVPLGKLEEKLRIKSELRPHEKGMPSLGQARRIAGLPRDFLELLVREGIQLHHCEEELRGLGG